MVNFLKHILVSTWKEMILLSRDKAGLLVLFLMPSVLVVIITLVQENVMELSGEKDSEILLYDADGGVVADKIRQALLATERLSLVELDPGEMDREAAVALIQQGKYQVCIVIPKDTSKRLGEHAADLFKPEKGEGRGPDILPLYFDPGVLPGYKTGIEAVLRMTLFRVEIELKIVALEKQVRKQYSSSRQNNDGRQNGPDLQRDLLEKALLQLATESASSTAEAAPNAVQHNIPAWSLFGLFFTCIPLAGSLLTERNSGIWIRLMAMPVSPGALLTGKIVAYVAVCFFQVGLIALIGFYLFPFLGLPSFSISGHVGLLLLISLCSSLAACGYGVFLGAVCSSLEQASMFGSISIVIAASLGGTLVPTYAMPLMMQKISSFSPLNWGLTCYQDVLLREASFWQVGDNLAKLVLFFVVMLALSWKLSHTRS